MTKKVYIHCDQCSKKTDAYVHPKGGIATGKNSSLWGPFVLCKKCNDKEYAILEQINRDQFTSSKDFKDKGYW